MKFLSKKIAALLIHVHGIREKDPLGKIIFFTKLKKKCDRNQNH